MELIEAQITAIIALGLGSMLVGLLPAWFSRRGRQQWPLLVSVLLCFGGGVLLSTSLVHILPELRELAPTYEKYAELLLCAGFFTLYLLDELAHFCYDESRHGDIHIHSHETLISNKSSTPALRQTASYGSIESTPRDYYEAKQPPYNPHYHASSSENDIRRVQEPTSQICHVTHEEPCNVSPISNFALLAALSVHAALEGLAVGLENSASKVLLLLGAIASHKLVVSFCLGLELSAAPFNTACKLFTSIAVFTFGSVLGIVIGMAISKISLDHSKTTIAVLQGLAAGSLLYVTVSEILPRERAKWHLVHNTRLAGIYQFTSVAVGFVVMTAMTKYLEA